MNRRTTLLLLALIIFVAGSALVIGLSTNQATNGACRGTSPKTHYQVIVQQDKAAPSRTSAHVCDTLTIVNKDKIAREIAFGPHKDHVPYDGVAERVLNDGESLTVTLNQAGSFRFHDHLHDEVVGYFTVSP